ncbi:hypothetical protein CDAR_604521 [Caerostris darwini]|uniref:Uncharacterized protein n=1 Tax=Caerostris darwini TaxID=1538125 RepID=A0AAV4NDB8_9ARAC|nr:hypothetical protein CDAR_604521 [Caerostris darwini]
MVSNHSSSTHVYHAPLPPTFFLLYFGQHVVTSVGFYGSCAKPVDLYCLYLLLKKKPPHLFDARRTDDSVRSAEPDFDEVASEIGGTVVVNFHLATHQKL